MSALAIVGAVLGMLIFAASIVLILARPYLVITISPAQTRRCDICGDDADRLCSLNGRDVALCESCRAEDPDFAELVSQ